MNDIHLNPCLFLTTVNENDPYLYPLLLFLGQAVNCATAGRDISSVDAVCSTGAWGRIISLDSTKNSKSSNYHVRWPECKVINVPLTELPGMIQNWKKSKLEAHLKLCQIMPPPWVPQESQTEDPTSQSSTMYMSPCRELWSQAAWSNSLKKQLLPLCTWLNTFILQPACHLTKLHQAMLQLSTQPSNDKTTNMDRPAVPYDLPVRQGHPTFQQAGLQCLTSDSRRAFSSVHTHLEWSSAGAVKPLKYEREGRILLQVWAQLIHFCHLFAF
ncbi:hypothetical protein CEUSTIGMA_g9441.t1 [Chlamydomonas eustigma]|uniref:Uncharacterized protein n=1 Tax=Chlamydomonas eustigma TaxID=1157962 RepID=A0A250XG38_9CHLO|nr:hypothetical protein CEUSTIGMA_g9441.t1 [Chlamydomonas eustigma]|eukprot:GAX82013.1 hypothetical protein CEUSTIGMA_g9441.t1 [Chlamydomonas eustigma]